MRKYVLASNPEYFVTGTMGNRQVVAGATYQGMLVVYFDLAGSYLEFVKESQWIDTDVDAMLAQWIAVSGLIQTPIAINSFFIADQWIGIRDLPEHFEEVLADPNAVDQSRYMALLKESYKWRQSGMFVFYWDEEYYVSRDGEVLSS